MSIEAIVQSGRRLIATSLLDRARIQDRALVRDSTGGQVESFTERKKTEACRFVSIKDNDPVRDLDSIFGRAEMVCSFPVGTLIEEGDRIRNLRDGGTKVFRVVKILTPPSDVTVVLRAGIKEEVV